VRATPSVVAREVVDVGLGMEDVGCRLPRLLKSTMIRKRVRCKRCRGGVVLVGEVALMRAWSLDLRIRLHLLP
jgi:hypothetical protein